MSKMSFSNEIYDESYEDNDIIPAIPDTTMTVLFARKVTSSSVIEETTKESNRVEKVQSTPKIDEFNKDVEADANNKCVCGKGPIPNITLTRLEAEKTRHNLIITAQRFRSKRETSSRQEGQGLDYGDYIVNGYKDTQEPWLAVFFHGSNPFCGGTIINHRFILTGLCNVVDSYVRDIQILNFYPRTAAHCFCVDVGMIERKHKYCYKEIAEGPHIIKYVLLNYPCFKRR